MAYISGHTRGIRFINGRENTVADALSPIGVNTFATEQTAINFQELAAAKQLEVEL